MIINIFMFICGCVCEKYFGLIEKGCSLINKWLKKDSTEA